MIRSFIILQSCDKLKVKKYSVVGKKRLSMVDADNKVPYEDILKKSSDYFESENNTLVTWKGALLFQTLASAEEKAATAEEVIFRLRK